MADNIDVTAGSGKTVAADDVGGILHQRVKISQGADGSATDVSSAAPLNVTVANTGANSTAIKVDNSAVTQPVSGTVSVSGVATASNQTSGAQITQIADAGGEIATVTGGKLDVNATASLAGTSLPISGATTAVGTAIVDSSGNQISSFGGGTQYTEADTDSTITGTAVMWEDTSDTLRSVSAAKPLPVDVKNTSVTVAQGTATSLKTQAEAYQGGSAVASGNPLEVNLRSSTVSVATSTKQSDGSQKSQVVDGSGNVIGSTSNALDINIKSGNPTSITANAGTNLNTSALALESGGNLATVAGAVRAEDAASADGHTGVGALAVRKATPADTSGTDGDYEFLQMKSGRLWTSATIDSALPAGSALVGKVGIDQTTPGTTNAVSSTNWPTTVDTNSGNKSASTIRMVLATDQPALTNALKVDGSAVTQPVSQATASSLNAQVVGNVAHDSAVSGNPVRTAGRARTSPITAVANDDVADIMTDIYGKVIVRESLREDLSHQQTKITSSTAETTIVTADATYKLDIYGLSLANTSATATKVTLKDSTAGTTRWVGYVPAGDTRGFMLSPSGAMKQNAANNNWTITCGTSVDSVEVTAFWSRSL